MASPGRPRGSDADRTGRTSSPRDWRIIRFLRRKPQPAKATGVDADGEEIVCALNDSKSSKRWGDAAAVLHECEKIHALDKDGAVLRVLKLDPEDPELVAELELDQAKREARAGGGSLISIDVPKLVDNIARNMKEVAAAASAQQSTAFSQGFAAMTSVVNLCLSLLVRVEQRLAHTQAEMERVIEANAESATEGEGGGLGRDQMAMMALSQIMQPQQANGHASGAPVDPALLARAMQAFQQFMATQNQGSENGGGS